MNDDVKLIIRYIIILTVCVLKVSRYAIGSNVNEQPIAAVRLYLSRD